jgi:hypothetical protein
MKQGFIYIWFDRKRKMYYIGSHWGTIKDNYICSSDRMRDAYRRRPEDFKRRIIQKNIERTKLLEEEHKWLSLILDIELGKKYYNLRKHKWGHWSTDINKRLTIGQKISKSQIGRKLSEDTKIKIGKANSKSLKNVKKSESARKKMSEYWTGRKQDPNLVMKRVASNTGKKREIVECPHCKKQGGINAMKIWHFEKCKYKGVL